MSFLIASSIPSNSRPGLYLSVVYSVGPVVVEHYGALFYNINGFLTSIPMPSSYVCRSDTMVLYLCATCDTDLLLRILI